MWIVITENYQHANIREFPLIWRICMIFIIVVYGNKSVGIKKICSVEWLVFLITKVYIHPIFHQIPSWRYKSVCEGFLWSSRLGASPEKTQAFAKLATPGNLAPKYNCQLENVETGQTHAIVKCYAMSHHILGAAWCHIWVWIQFTALYQQKSETSIGRLISIMYVGDLYISSYHRPHF